MSWTKVLQGSTCCRGSHVRVKAHRIDEARAGGVPDATPLLVGAHPNKIPGIGQWEIALGIFTENSLIPLYA